MLKKMLCFSLTILVGVPACKPRVAKFPVQSTEAADQERQNLFAAFQAADVPVPRYFVVRGPSGVGLALASDDDAWLLPTLIAGGLVGATAGIYFAKKLAGSAAPEVRSAPEAVELNHRAGSGASALDPSSPTLKDIAFSPSRSAATMSRSSEGFSVEFMDTKKGASGVQSVPIRLSTKLPDGQVFVKTSSIERVTLAADIAPIMRLNEEANLILPVSHPLVQASKGLTPFDSIPGYQLRLIDSFEAKNGHVMFKVLRDDGLPTYYQQTQANMARLHVFERYQNSLTKLESPALPRERAEALSTPFALDEQPRIGEQVLIPRSDGSYSYGYAFGRTADGSVLVSFLDGSRSGYKGADATALRRLTADASAGNQKVRFAPDTKLIDGARRGVAASGPLGGALGESRVNELYALDLTRNQRDKILYEYLKDQVESIDPVGLAKLKDLSGPEVAKKLVSDFKIDAGLIDQLSKKNFDFEGSPFW